MILLSFCVLSETTGNGLGGEADVIFSSNSFIPRQISLKGQVDAFGYAFEAFEVRNRSARGRVDC